MWWIGTEVFDVKIELVHGTFDAICFIKITVFPQKLDFKLEFYKVVVNKFKKIEYLIVYLFKCKWR